MKNIFIRFSLLTLSLILSGQMVSAQMSHMDNEDNEDTSVTTCTKLTHTLSLGSRDAITDGQVTDLQLFLQENDFLTSEPTGFFGKVTRKAVQEFQTKYGIRPTGRVGPITRAEIKKVSCKGNTDPISHVPNSRVPNITIITTPLLKLGYSSYDGNEELKMSFVARVTAGNTDFQVNTLGNSVSPSYFYLNLHSTVKPDIRTNSMTLPTVTSLSGQNIVCNTTHCTIPAGQSADFSVVQSAFPRELFAGSYYSTLSFYFENSGDIAPKRKTNNVTIIGETSPYISSVTSDANGNVTINGARLNLMINTILVNGVIVFPISNLGEGGTPSKIMFSSKQHSKDGLASGQHVLQITNSQTGNSNTVGFTVGTVAPAVTSIPTVTIVGAPTLKLGYDLMQKEVDLIATFDVSVTAPASGSYISVSKLYPIAGAYSFGVQALGGYGVTKEKIKIDQISGGALGSAINNETTWLVPPGRTVVFQVSQTFNPKQMFAGQYSAQVFFTDVTGTNYVNTNRTNDFTIIGETSPYISGVTVDANGVVVIKGSRLDLSSNVIVVNGRISIIGGTKGDATFLSFHPTQYGVTSGQHVLQITNSQTGNSNTVGFTVGTITITSLPATDISTNSATINGSINATSGFSHWFYWGISPGLGKQSGSVSYNQSNNTANFTETITGLMDGTTYYYRAGVGDNATGVNLYGSILSFTTKAVATPTITITYPQAGAIFAPGDRVNVNWSSTELFGMQVNVTLDGLESSNKIQTHLATFVQINKGSVSVVLPISLVPGKYKISVWVTNLKDGDPRLVSSANIISVQSVITTAPTVSIVGLGGQTYNIGDSVVWKASVKNAPIDSRLCTILIRQSDQHRFAFPPDRPECVVVPNPNAEIPLTGTLIPNLRGNLTQGVYKLEMDLIAGLSSADGKGPISYALFTSGSFNITAQTTPAPTATISLSPTSVATTGTFTATWAGNNSPTSYNLNLNETIHNMGTATSWSGRPESLGLTAGKHFISVQACNATGCGKWTEVVTLMVTAPVVTSTLPTATISLSPTSVATTGTFTASWSGNNSPTSYNLNLNETIHNMGTATSWSGRPESLGLTAGKHFISVQACNATGCGKWTEVVTLTVTAPVVISTLPTATISLSPTSVATTGTFTATWSGNNSPTSYNLNLNETIHNMGTATSWSGRPESLGLTAGKHFISVQACNATGCGKWTEVVTLTVTEPTQTGIVLGVATECVQLFPNMHRGSELPAVSKLQAFLIAQGLLAGSPTGFFGDKTIAAVKAYQEATGLPMTGMVYGATRASIKAMTCQ